MAPFSPSGINNVSNYSVKVIDWIWRGLEVDGGRQRLKEREIEEVKCSTLLLNRSFSVDVTHISLVLLDLQEQ